MIEGDRIVVQSNDVFDGCEGTVVEMDNDDNVIVLLDDDDEELTFRYDELGFVVRPGVTVVNSYAGTANANVTIFNAKMTGTTNV